MSNYWPETSNYIPSKRVVHYRPEPDQRIIVGKPAFIYPVDHPDSDHVSNTTIVITSTVQSYATNGEFFTNNTHYVPSFNPSISDTGHLQLATNGRI